MFSHFCLVDGDSERSGLDEWRVSVRSVRDVRSLENFSIEVIVLSSPSRLSLRPLPSLLSFTYTFSS